MNTLRNVILILIVCTNVVRSQDTNAVAQGVIRVRKPVSTHFVKAEYKLFLSNVRWTEELVYYHGYPEKLQVPVYDSAVYAASLERLYPAKSVNIGRYFAQRMGYNYPVSDTPRVDTLVLGLYLNTDGKIRYVDPDTEDAYNMNATLKAELASTAMSLEGQDWGKGGGYYLPPHGLHGKEFVAESYYCELTIIVSSMPLTPDQKSTRAVFPPRDIPLNCEPVDMDLMLQPK